MSSSQYEPIHSYLVFNPPEERVEIISEMLSLLLAEFGSFRDIEYFDGTNEGIIERISNEDELNAFFKILKSIGKGDYPEADFFIKFEVLTPPPFGWQYFKIDWGSISFFSLSDEQNYSLKKKFGMDSVANTNILLSFMKTIGTFKLIREMWIWYHKSAFIGDLYHLYRPKDLEKYIEEMIIYSPGEAIPFLSYQRYLKENVPVDIIRNIVKEKSVEYEEIDDEKIYVRWCKALDDFKYIPNKVLKEISKTVSGYLKKHNLKTWNEWLELKNIDAREVTTIPYEGTNHRFEKDDSFFDKKLKWYRGLSSAYPFTPDFSFEKFEKQLDLSFKKWTSQNTIDEGKFQGTVCEFIVRAGLLHQVYNDLNGANENVPVSILLKFFIDRFRDSRWKQYFRDIVQSHFQFNQELFILAFKRIQSEDFPLPYYQEGGLDSFLATTIEPRDSIESLLYVMNLFGNNGELNLDTVFHETDQLFRRKLETREMYIEQKYDDFMKWSFYPKSYWWRHINNPYDNPEDTDLIELVILES